MTTPSAYQNRINNLRNLAKKLAFSPAGAMPPMDPAMMGGAGAPPMDPSMMGGAGAPPPIDPAMMGGAPMDPTMMGGAGAPPMDPAMTSGGMPADPSMAQGDPAAMSQGPDMMELMDMVQAIGYMLTQICKKLEIPIGQQDQKDDAEAAMLNDEEKAALDAQQAEDDAQGGVLSDQAEEELAAANPGYIQDKLNQFQQA